MKNLKITTRPQNTITSLAYIETSVDVDDFIKQNPEVKMIVPAVSKSNSQSVGYVTSEQIESFNEQERKFSAITPFEYMRQFGLPMIFPNLDSYKYILQREENLPSANSNLSTLEEEIGEFEYDPNESTLYWTGRKTAVKLTNFYIELKERYLLMSLQGQEEMISLEVKNESRCESFEIPLGQLNNLNQTLKQCPEFFTYSEVGAGKVNQLLRQYISELYNEVKNVLPFTVKYANHGWNEDEQNCRHYFSGNDPNCFNDLRLADYLTAEPIDLIAWCFGLLQIGSQKIMLPLMLQMHLGFTLKLFENAGYNEQFILTVIGESGSKKTSLAREMFCLFGESIINFQSTERAIELELMNRQDATLILDDLSSGNDKNLAMKFERILRQLGDSTGRKRAVNGGNEQDCVQTRCAVTVTAESDIDILSKSSKLRTLAVYINKNSLVSEILALYQADSVKAKNAGQFSKLEQYITLYIRFLEFHYAESVEIIRRAKFQTSSEDLNFARQATIFTMLTVQAELILHFWRSWGALTEEESSQIYDDWLAVIYSVIRQNETRGQTAEPYLLFLQAVGAALTKNLIAQNKDSYSMDSRSIGYRENGKIMLDPDFAFSYVVEFYRKQNLMFNESQQNILNKLYEQNLIETYPQKDHKPKLLKQVKINGAEKKMICLKWSLTENFFDEELK